MFIGAESLLGSSFSCVQFKGVVDLLNGHNTLRMHLHVTRPCVELTSRSGKE